MQLELYDILFSIRCLKESDESKCIQSYMYEWFSNSNTRSTKHLKLNAPYLKHMLLDTPTSIDYLGYGTPSLLWTWISLFKNLWQLNSSTHSREMSHAHFILSVLAPDVWHVLFLISALFVLCLKGTSTYSTGVPSVHSVTSHIFFILF